MTFASVEEILTIDDAQREEVTVPEWGGVTILVASATAEERAEIEKRWSKKEASSDPAAFRADVLERSLKKSDGTPWATKEQIKALMGKNASAIERLFEAACRVCAFTKRDVEELAKN